MNKNAELIKRLRELRDEQMEIAHDRDMDPRQTANWAYAETCGLAIEALKIRPIESAADGREALIKRLRDVMGVINKKDENLLHPVYTLLQEAADMLAADAPEQERTFCHRCGKRIGEPGHIHTCTPPAPQAQELSDAEISAAARALSDGQALVCGTDPEDTWKTYYQEYMDDARAALEAARAVLAARSES